MKTETFKIFYTNGTEGTITIESKNITGQRGLFNITEMTRKGKIIYKNIRGKYRSGNNDVIELFDVEQLPLINEVDEETHFRNPTLNINGNKRLIDFMHYLNETV
ncbi:hypothetical protein [Acetobacterium woodii]|uniref:Uncharacterized protein n=1 Tax=Acetobacterium woodii (strain ATCC 29683 / DSM 1030 / JCM 2381 / KCTC 1655 / WB1) TaxID=931626 RepID=H6LGX0_ACEWD|nr:hypothetical protein [Acetobacterium woodii]AFA49634.1 hypothetical protein Awo_c28850 [Acetobacterium woodii DSM 1030]